MTGEPQNARTGLPRGIGQPATRALNGAGIVYLEDLTSWSEAELRALHGAGPKAIRLIQAALVERGLSLKSGSAG